MTHDEIATMIEGVGLPFAYNTFKKSDRNRPSGPPFICFLYPDDDDFMADNRNFARITALSIELYTDDIDFALEGRVAAALDAAQLPHTRDRRYIEGERMYLTTYETEVLLTDA